MPRRRNQQPRVFKNFQDRRGRIYRRGDDNRPRNIVNLQEEFANGLTFLRVFLTLLWLAFALWVLSRSSVSASYEFHASVEGLVDRVNSQLGEEAGYSMNDSFGAFGDSCVDEIGGHPSGASWSNFSSTSGILNTTIIETDEFSESNVVESWDTSGFVCLHRDEVEIQVRKLHCVNRAQSNPPINIEDTARSEVEIERALQAGEQLVRVNQDTRLNFRVLDLRTPANQAIFRIQYQVENIFRQSLFSEGFIGIHTPKLIAGSSEGGSVVFRFEYKGKPACLAQSPQLHKQMSICAGFPRVFEVGSVFRAEDSFTHRHLCEFTGLDVEMEIKQHYSEVMDFVDRLFVTMFDYLNANCSMELEAINRQYPFEKLKYLRNTLRLTFEEGVQMLKVTNQFWYMSERDPTLLAKELKLKVGKLSTGNSLDMCPEDAAAILANDATVKEMEGAAVAYVSDLLKVPVIFLKAVTDIVDGDKPTSEEFYQNLAAVTAALGQNATQL